MGRIVGFALFFIGIGIIFSVFLPNRFVEVLVVIGLLVLGYNLFTSPCKRK